MTVWPWFICPACARRKRCGQHAAAAPGETPYRTLTRCGFLSVFVPTDDAEHFRWLLRREAGADRLRIHTYEVPSGRELTFVLAELGDYTLSNDEQVERMREALRDLRSASPSAGR